MLQIDIFVKVGNNALTLILECITRRMFGIETASRSEHAKSQKAKVAAHFCPREGIQIEDLRPGLLPGP